MNAYTECCKRKFCIVKIQQYIKGGYECNWGWETDKCLKCRFVTGGYGDYCLLRQVRIEVPDKRYKHKDTDYQWVQCYKNRYYRGG
jgi:hypothetical protein